MKDRNELFKELNQFFWLVTGLAGVGSVLTVLALFRDSITKRERTLAANDVKFSTALARHTEEAAAAQIQNLKNVSGLIKFVHDAFDLQEKQKKALDDLRKQQEEGFTAQIELLRTALTADKQREEERKRDATTKYAQVVGMMSTFDNTQALEWPTLPPHLLRLADHARIELQSIPRDSLRDIVAERPNDHASMLQRMGVAAYYDFYQIGIALDLLSEAEKLFEVATNSTFNKVRAYTQHFLAIIEKNWCLKGDSIGISLGKAADRLRKAVTILGDEPGHFLTPVTLSEVLSYRDEAAFIEGCECLKTVFDKVDPQQVAKLDKNQTSLYARALLLRGNIEFRRVAAKTPSEPAVAAAHTYYEQAAGVASKNPYAWLSLARTLEPCRMSESPQPETVTEAWRKGLEALKGSDALGKQEMTQRVTAIVWGILAAHRVGARTDEHHYRENLRTSGADKMIGGRFPLFFSPFKMTVVPFSDLENDLNIATTSSFSVQA